MNLPRRALDLGLAALFAAQLAASAWLTLDGGSVRFASGRALGRLCWWRSLLGHDCPLCGMTRSFVALAHGDLAGALRWHVAGPLLFAFMAISIAAVAAAWLRGQPPMVERRRFLAVFQGVALIGVMLGFVQMGRS